MRKIKHNAHCMDEMRRLRQESQIRFKLPSLFDLQHDYHSIFFNNCQSFIGKVNALKNDFNVKGSLLAGFAETRLNVGENVEDFGEFGHQYHLADDDRPSLGISAFSKIEASHSNNVIYRNSKNEKVGSCMFIQVPNAFKEGSLSRDMTVVFCYITPGCSKEVYAKLSCDILAYLDKIESEHCVVLGDFNKSPSEINDVFGAKLMQKNLRQIISETTHDHGKKLDHIYTTFPENQIKYGVLESLTTTDHRPIFVSIKKVV